MKDWDEATPQVPPAQPPAGEVTAGRLRRVPRPWLASAALVGSGLVAGGILAGSHVAGAQTPAQTTPPAVTTPADRDPAAVGHGPNETLLTGDTAARVTAAALKAVPGATVIRVETDSAGSAYEAHMRKADGSSVTVKLDKDFNVTSTETGFGGHG